MSQPMLLNEFLLKSVSRWISEDPKVRSKACLAAELEISKSIITRATSSTGNKPQFLTCYQILSVTEPDFLESPAIDEFFKTHYPKYTCIKSHYDKNFNNVYSNRINQRIKEDSDYRLAYFYFVYDSHKVTPIDLKPLRNVMPMPKLDKIIDYMLKKEILVKKEDNLFLDNVILYNHKKEGEKLKSTAILANADLFSKIESHVVLTEVPRSKMDEIRDIFNESMNRILLIRDMCKNGEYSNLCETEEMVKMCFTNMLGEI